MDPSLEPMKDGYERVDHNTPKRSVGEKLEKDGQLRRSPEVVGVAGEEVGGSRHRVLSLDLALLNLMKINMMKINPGGHRFH